MVVGLSKVGRKAVVTSATLADSKDKAVRALPASAVPNVKLPSSVRRCRTFDGSAAPGLRPRGRASLALLADLQDLEDAAEGVSATSTADNVMTSTVVMWGTCRADLQVS